nr:SH3 domain-containing protein [Chloroflexota bacterium]
MPTLRQGAIRWLVPALVGLLCLGLFAPTFALAASDLEIGGTATIAGANGDDVRLRAAPGYDAAVLAMLPEGTTVAVIDGPISADDGSVWYQAETTDGTGYIVADFLAASSGTETTAATDVNAAEVTTAAVGSDGQTATTTTALNLRSGPSTTNAVLLVMPAGSTVTITGSAQNGFYPVTFNGTGGWASTNYLTLGGSGTTPTPGSGTATVTSALNLRSGPSTSDPVISVMPAGATVTLTGESANGFLGVTYNGRTGWAYATFLSTSGATPPPTPEPSPGTGTATVTNSLNLRAGPS